MRKVVSVRVLERYLLDVAFDDGVSGVVDLSHLAGQGVFSAWSEAGAFERVAIGAGGELVWGDLIDLCPDSLYLKVTGKTPEELFPALRHASAHA